MRGGRGLIAKSFGIAFFKRQGLRGAKMDTYIEYLEVIKYTRVTVPNTERVSQSLVLKIPQTDTRFSVSICNRIRLPQLKRGDKVRLILDFYTCGRSKQARWTVRDVILLLDSPAIEIPALKTI